MDIVILKRKKYFILLFVLLALAAITAGIYLFVNSKTNGSTSYSVDKYSDVVNWCDTSVRDGKLSVDCKALLLEIRSGESGESCFEVQVITKDKGLKDLTVCEGSDTLAYTNEVLEYKKLMPIDMVFTYVKEGILGSYSFNHVSFTKLEDTYVQSIVNEDISNLVTIDPSTTTIQNSVDFCPKPEILPDYVTEANSESYLRYTNTNSLETGVGMSKIYDIDGGVTNAFLPCYPDDNCKYSNLLSTPLLATGEVFPPEWGADLSNYDYDTLAQLSYFYAEQNTILPTYAPYISEGEEPYITTSTEVFAKIVGILSSKQDISEEIFCTVYQAVNFLSVENKELVSPRESMQRHISSNISKSTFPLCSKDINQNEYNSNGIYIMYRMSVKDDKLTILNRCLNLDNFLR